MASIRIHKYQFLTNLKNPMKTYTKKLRVLIYSRVATVAQLNEATRWKNYPSNQCLINEECRTQSLPSKVIPAQAFNRSDKTKSFTAIYIRTNLQSSSGRTLLKEQAFKCRAYCAKRGWSHIKIYSDMCSGNTASPPKMAALKADLLIGSIKRVVTYNLSRISRRDFNIVTFWRFLCTHNVPIIIVSGGIDTEVPIWKQTMDAICAGILASRSRKAKSEP